jgi:hypothetical protein
MSGRSAKQNSLLVVGLGGGGGPWGGFAKVQVTRQPTLVVVGSSYCRVVRVFSTFFLSYAPFTTTTSNWIRSPKKDDDMNVNKLPPTTDSLAASVSVCAPCKSVCQRLGSTPMEHGNFVLIIREEEGKTTFALAHLLRHWRHLSAKIFFKLSFI